MKFSRAAAVTLPAAHLMHPRVDRTDSEFAAQSEPTGRRDEDERGRRGRRRLL